MRKFRSKANPMAEYDILAHPRAEYYGDERFGYIKVWCGETQMPIYKSFKHQKMVQVTSGLIEHVFARSTHFKTSENLWLNTHNFVATGAHMTLDSMMHSIDHSFLGDRRSFLNINFSGASSPFNKKIWKLQEVYNSEDSSTLTDTELITLATPEFLNLKEQKKVLILGGRPIKQKCKLVGLL